MWRKTPMCGKEKVGRTRGVLGLRNDTMVSSLDFLSASQACQKGGCHRLHAGPIKGTYRRNRPWMAITLAKAWTMVDWKDRVKLATSNQLKPNNNGEKTCLFCNSEGAKWRADFSPLSPAPWNSWQVMLWFSHRVVCERPREKNERELKGEWRNKFTVKRFQQLSTLSIWRDNETENRQEYRTRDRTVDQ